MNAEKSEEGKGFSRVAAEKGAQSEALDGRKMESKGRS
jgi:hypothetical protein